MDRPVEIWPSFRPGSKAQSFDRPHDQIGTLSWVSGSHTGYQSISARHSRWLAIRLLPSGAPLLVVVDSVQSSVPLCWRFWFHRAPSHPNAFHKFQLTLRHWCDAMIVQATASSSPYSLAFGQTIQRPMLHHQGHWSAGSHNLVTVLSPGLETIRYTLRDRQIHCLDCDSLGLIEWGGSNPPSIAV